MYFVSGNSNKFREVKAFMSGFNLEQVTLDIPEIQGSAQEIAKDKAVKAALQMGRPVFVEDTGLFLNALGGFPGPYVKYFFDGVKKEGLHQMLSSLKDTSAYSQCTIGYCIPGHEPLIIVGQCTGNIVPPRGETKFLFDNIFIPKGHTRVFSEMNLEEKNQISHRGKAFDQFVKYLSSHQP